MTHDRYRREGLREFFARAAVFFTGVREAADVVFLTGFLGEEAAGRLFFARTRAIVSPSSAGLSTT